MHSTDRTGAQAEPSFAAPDNLKLLTIGQVREVLGLSRVAFYELRRKGQFPPHVQVGRAPRWRVSVVKAWMDAGGSQPSEKQAADAS